MRALAAFVFSFVVALAVGALLYPQHVQKTAGSRRLRVGASTALDFIPGLPSLVAPSGEDSAARYEAALRLVRAGRFRPAKAVYLEILSRDPRAEKAMRGLVTLERLLTNQDPDKLERQASAYRRRAVTGPHADQYSSAELEVLTEANLAAAGQIRAERGAFAASRLKVSLAELQGSAGRASRESRRDTVATIRERLGRFASSLGLMPLSKSHSADRPLTAGVGSAIGAPAVAAGHQGSAARIPPPRPPNPPRPPRALLRVARPTPRSWTSSTVRGAIASRTNGASVRRAGSRPSTANLSKAPRSPELWEAGSGGGGSGGPGSGGHGGSNGDKGGGNGGSEGNGGGNGGQGGGHGESR